MNNHGALATPGPAHNILVFSDLDGTLLDPVAYSSTGAEPALALLRARGIPLLLCSSKTRAEMVAVRRRLGNEHPFIAENGGGIFIPPGYFAVPPDNAQDLAGYRVVILGTPHAEVRRRFVALRERLGVAVRGFTDMTVEEVAALTGLDVALAALARQRDFDEPFVFEGAPDPGFLRAIEESGLTWTQGRLFHILGRHDKGRAVRLLRGLFERERGPSLAIGLGDALNDLPLLEAVDQAVLVRHADGSCDARLAVPGLLTSVRPGPPGWGETLLQLLTGSGAEKA
ncbi:MAG: HAD-IIB family hydrolase [Sulfuricella sp.]|nr:HAD-IIB family hydrolase [Sulfuricella sp.]